MIEETVFSTPLIDVHAHPVEELSSDTIKKSFADYFGEGAISTEHKRHTINYRAVLKLLRDYFGDLKEEELLKKRANVDLKTYSKEMIDKTNSEIILTDDGFPDVSPAEFEKYTNSTVLPILRLETLVESLIDKKMNFEDFIDKFEYKVKKALDDDYIGLKSIIAYRCGLDIKDPSLKEAKESYREVVQEWNGRIANENLLGYILNISSDIAEKYDVPIQFHTGFGDPDAHPYKIDPSALFDFAEQNPKTDIIVLHAGYPYVRKSGYITSCFDNVYVDLSLTIPFVQHGSKQVIREILELAPTTKVLYGSDAFSNPEIYVLAANRIRNDLSTVLNDLVEEEYITEDYAIESAKRILRNNTKRLYDL